MFYKLNTFDKLFKELANENKTYTYTATSNSFEVEVLEDGKQKVTINTLGHNPKEIQVDVTEEISAVSTTVVISDMTIMECLEYAYRWTNNVLGSWSIKKTSFPDPANGDRINGDYNEDVTVLAPRADGMGLRSTSMFDRMIADGKTYKVDMMGFKEVVM